MQTRYTLFAAAALGGLATFVLAQDVADKPDRSWISLTGNVLGTSVEAFTLDHGEGVITVEMDDWDW